MKDEEKTPSQIGLYDIPRSAAHPTDKVLKIFNTFKRRAKETASHSSAQVTPLRELQPNLQDLQVSAMNSYRIGPDVIKTDGGFEVV